MRRSRTYADTPIAPFHGDQTAGAMIEDEDEDEEDRSRHQTARFIPAPELQYHPREQQQQQQQQQETTLLHSLASFLSLSDAAAAANLSSPFSRAAAAAVEEEDDSWAVGIELDNGSFSSSWSINTPLTPALVALSPGATPQLLHHNCVVRHDNHEDDYDDQDDVHMQKLLNERRRRWAQEKITSAVFAHPRSLRSFCWEAFWAARNIRALHQQEQQQRQQQDDDEFADHPQDLNDDPETYIEPTNYHHQHHHQQHHHRRPSNNSRKRRRSSKLYHRSLPRFHIGRFLHSIIFQNIPLSVTLNLLEALGGTTVGTSGATLTITVATVHLAAATTGRAARIVFDTVTHVCTNPFQILEAIISLQFNAMGKTSEVLVSGIQSVATGMGSASSSALYRLSATVQMSANASVAGGNYHHHGNRTNLMPGCAEIQKNAVLNKKLLKKLAVINDAALVVEYRERETDDNGLTRRAVSRTRRMMHYSVSLRPFVATIAVGGVTGNNNNNTSTSPSSFSPLYHDGEEVTVLGGDVSPPMASFHHQQQPHHQQQQQQIRRETSSNSVSADSTNTEEYSPFMCTPQSFPPTPHSRQVVIDQRSQLSDDVVFLARDRLRVHDGLASHDERTRARSMALENGKRLAIFASDDLGIELSCGRHIATKVGNMYYASARSMVPVLRNCYVYTEFTVLPRPGIPLKAAVASLSIGVSTQEMPPNTLVGAWQGSVGLSTTGQILLAGQWCSPENPAMCAFGVGATVGVLVYLDDDSAFETWEGRMVKSAITFNVNGAIVSPPVYSSLSTPGVPSMMMPGRQGNFFGASSNCLEHRISPIQHPGHSALLPTATLTLLVPSAEDLYPTVTMQSSATSVVSRFSSEDIVAQRREQIGAPPDVTIYAIDGSIVVLEEDFTTSDESSER